jgi:hypothetical protein
LTNSGDGAKSACENEFKIIVTHRNEAPIIAITGFTEIDPLSSLNNSITHCLKFIIFVFL